jgi:hypothetical protein
MFEIRHAGAKGFGIFASASIPRGSRILAEKALLSINKHNTNILTAARQLSPVDSKALLRLSLNESKRSDIVSLILAAWQSFPFNAAAIRQSRAILNIFYNNNFAISDRLGTRSVFPTVARINHSCVPNSQGNFNESLRSFTIHATRDISHGEEVTISYLHDQLALRTARQAKLYEGYGFQCGCELCSGNSQRRRESHDRRTEMQAKLKAFAEKQYPGISHMASQKLALTQFMIDTHEQEGLAGRELASLYAAAAGLAVKLQDHSLAKALGARGLQLEVDAVGIDSPFYQATLLAFTHMKFQEETVTPVLSEDTEAELSYAPWT